MAGGKSNFREVSTWNQTSGPENVMGIKKKRDFGLFF